MLKLKNTSQDQFLGGKVTALQPLHGYRAAIDTVLLAAATPLKKGQKVLDVGAGVGVASLCLAQRDIHCQICSLEMQPELVQLANQNVELNQYENKIRVIEGNLESPPQSVLEEKFDVVMTNPPYYEEGKSHPSPHLQKATSSVESVALKSWLDFCIRVLKPKGTLTFIHRADRMDEILSYLYERMGEIVVFPLWPAQGKPARRIIIRARKNIKSGLQISQGLTLHTPHGQYTPEAEDVLRFGKSLAY